MVHLVVAIDSVILVDLVLAVDLVDSLNLSDFYNHVLAVSFCLYFQKSDYVLFYGC